MIYRLLVSSTSTHVDISNYCSLSELGADDIQYGPLASSRLCRSCQISQSPLVVFKSRNMLQALGIIYSRIVLPSTDVKGETKGKTYCPSTWNYAYQWEYAAKYAD